MKTLIKIFLTLLTASVFLVFLLYRAPLLASVQTYLARRTLPSPIPAREPPSRGEPSQIPPTTGQAESPPTGEEFIAPIPPARDEPTPPATSSALPREFNLAVPFTSQAPHADWSMPFQEACEEASLAMVDAFYDGRAFTRENATAEILDVVAWETENLFHWEDTDAEDTARILRERYGYRNTRVEYDVTLDDIKREVAQGRPVIVPAAGRLLKNRYFTPPGPIYHMLVVRGWTRDGKIITNDPGTKRGEGYLYDPKILENAIHDLNSGDVLNGRRAMIVAIP